MHNLLRLVLLLCGSTAWAMSLTSPSAPATAPAGIERFTPEQCVELAAPDRQAREGTERSDPEARWNESYRRGFRALEREDYHDAEQHMCHALMAARGFGPRDWRFAETLDELGLIAFTLRDFDRAEHVQGAAIAEMLLAVGPHGEPFRDKDASEQAPIREDCRSGIHVYTTRLGWIHDQVPGRIATAELARTPWRIFAAGYLPLDAQLAKRLDWLISRYLLEENLAAAEELGDLQRRILGDER
jgi:hypothetical protein